MASTFSPILRIELIGTGDQSGTWGNTTNVNLGTLIEQAIAGTATIDVTAGNVTLSNLNGVTDQSRCMALRTTGLPGASRNLIAPAVSKLYVVANGSNAVNVIKTSTSTGVSIPVGEILLVFYDTTLADFRIVGRTSTALNSPNTLVLRDGSGNFAAGTITANLTGNVTGNLNGNLTAAAPTAPTAAPGTNTTQVATTAFVQNVAGGLGTMSTQNANNVNITGGSITGITDLAVADGGTGRSSLTTNNIILGNDTSAVNFVAPSTTGNFLTSNGTTWVSAAPSIPALSTATGSAPSYSARAFVLFDGNVAANKTGTYTQSASTTVVVSIAAHGLAINDRVFLDFTSGTAGDAVFTVETVPDANTFTVSRVSASTGGNVTLVLRSVSNAQNVSSVSRIASGQYIINFTTAMVNANFATLGSAAGATVNINTGYNNTTKSVVISTGEVSRISVVVFS
jgi:hypothetical protein